MPTDLYITLDIYLRDWTSTAGEAWVCLQPHVAAQNDTDTSLLEAWIRDCATGAAFNFHMKSATDPSALIPVNFPDDVNVGLQLQFDDGTSKVFSNMRRASYKVLDPSSLDKANRQAPSVGAVNAPSTSQPVPQDFFSVAYNRSVRAAAQASSNSSQFAATCKNMMVLAFWGGTRRYVPVGSIDLSSGTNLMRLEDSTADLLVTNLHSLNGLMFLLGTRSDLPTLKTLKDIHVLLSTGDPATPTFTVSRDDASAQGTINSYFHNIPDAMPQDRLPSATWDSSVAKRVYVVDNLLTFANQTGFDDGNWYRRRVEQGANSSMLQLSGVSKVVVHFNADNNAPAPDPTKPQWNQLTWAVYDSIDLVLTPYRQFPSKTVANGPLALSALPADSQRFEALLSTQPALFKRNDIVLVDAHGINYLGPGANKLSFLGAYSFPWDASDDDTDDQGNPCQPHTTVLMFGPMPSSPAATKYSLTLIFPRLAGNNAPVTFTTQRIGDGANPDAFGLRWEFRPIEPLPSEDFSFLRCTQIPDSTLLSRLIPGVAFKGAVGFEFAQSMSNIETAINVLYEHPDPPVDPQHVDPVQEFVHDLINHNALNVYGAWDGKALDVDEGAQRGRKTVVAQLPVVGHLNPYGQIYPVSSTQPDSTAYNYRFVFRHLVRTAEPFQSATDTGAPDVRGFFSDLYSRAGKPRSLAFDLQHTYGTLIPVPLTVDGQSVDFIGDVPSFFDFPLVIPPDVTRPVASNNPSASIAGPCTSGAAHFFTATFTVGADGSETVTLTLQTSWLRPEYYDCGNGEMRSAHIAAWRTIAEIAISQIVAITGLFRRFSFSEALTPCAGNSVAAGLQPVEPFESHPDWPVPDGSLRAACIQLLNGGPIADTLSVPVVLTQPPDQPKIVTTCNVIELYLRVTRDPQDLPSNLSNSWLFVRSLPGVDANGQQTEPVADPTALASFSAYVTSLSQRKRAVAPLFSDLAQANQSAYLQSVLGGSSVSGQETASDSGSSWIVPGGFQYTGSAVPSVTSVAFLPFPLDGFLGSATFNLICSYFEAVQAVLGCNFKDGWTWGLANWQAFFNNLSGVVPLIDPSRPGTLLNAAMALVFPVPPKDGAVDQEVKNTVTSLSDSTSPLFSAFRSWLTLRLWADPSVFSSTRAFLYHRLRASTSGAVPDDFFRIDSVRQTGKPGDAIDTPRLNFKESLAGLAKSDLYGIPEVLSYLNYDKTFVFTDYSLPNFEKILFDAANAPAPSGSRLFVPIESDGTTPVLHLPDGPQKLPTTQIPLPPASPVLLPSRAPIVPPVHLFTGLVDDFQVGGYAPTLIGKSFAFDLLKLGEFNTPIGSQEAVAYINGTASARVPAADEYVLTAIFGIRGDEDSATSWYTAFDNDDFDFAYEETIIGLSRSPSPEPPAVIQSLFKDLGSQTHPELIQSLPQRVFDKDVVQFVVKALQAQPAASPTSQGVLTISHASGGVQSVDLTVRTPAGGLSDFEACLLGSPAAAGTSPAKLILVVNRVSKVWTRGAIGLTQTRNLRPTFAPQFGEVSGQVLPDQPYQPLVVNPPVEKRPMVLPPLQSANRTCSVAYLVGLIGITDPIWRTFDVSLTLSHKQQRSYPSFYIDDQGSFATSLLKAQSSSFPSTNPQHSANDASDLNVVNFDPLYKDFVIELQWSSKSNLQFFRVIAEGSFSS